MTMQYNTTKVFKKPNSLFSVTIHYANFQNDCNVQRFKFLKSLSLQINFFVKSQYDFKSDGVVDN